MGHITVRGTDLYYETWGEQSGEHGREHEGDGPPILLIPPSGSTASTWGALSGELAKVGRVIAYDRRGYPRSGGGVVREARVHTADAASLLEAVAMAPAVVVGTSAGATIALDLAVRRPDLVAAVVSHEAPWRALLHPDVSGLTMLARMQSLTWRGRYDDATDVLLRNVYAYRDGGSAWDAFPDEWRRVARESGRSVVADLRATLRSYPRHSDLARLAVPVMCTYGSRSRSYMRAVTRALAESIPTATVREIEGSAHAVPFDAPGTFAQVIADAVAAVDAVAGAAEAAGAETGVRSADVASGSTTS